jgi:hypothetical protein
MVKRLSLPFLVFVAAATALASGPLKEGSLTAESDGTTITVRWVSEDETGVSTFELERKAGLYGQFFPLTGVAPRGDNSIYEYKDDTALRIGAESVYQYRVKAVMSDGSAVYSEEVTVIHAVSSVRRTWGSIKAMFR